MLVLGFRLGLSPGLRLGLRFSFADANELQGIGAALAVGWMPDQMVGGPLITMNGVIRFADPKIAADFATTAELKFDRENLNVSSDREAVRIQTSSRYLVKEMPKILSLFDR